MIFNPVYGGTSAPNLGSKTITANGTYLASSDNLDGYDEVVANVPNTYVASDEGKVVSDGTLVAQTSTNISANGTYDITTNNSAVVNVPNSYTASDEGKVVSNGALVAQTSVTYSSNNTYDTTLINSVTVNVPSSGGIQVITRSDWNALTTAQKQAYGLIAIQDASTGFDRGELVYGADYIPLGIYIPNSTASDILCEAYLSNFDATSTSWGFGSIPITLTTMASMQDNSVLLDAYNGGAYGYVDLGAASTPFTAYVVAKTTAGSNYRRIISAMNSRSSGQGMLLYGTTVNISSWANDTSTGISSTAAYFVGVIRFASSGNAKGFVKNASSNLVSVAKTPSAAGRYVTIGRTDPNASTSNAEPTSVLVKYIAVVSGAESDAVIEANINNLIASFLS